MMHAELKRGPYAGDSHVRFDRRKVVSGVPGVKSPLRNGMCLRIGRIGGRVALASVCWFAAFAAMGGVLVETCKQGTIHWETLFKRSVNLPVVWPKGAVSASLTVVDLAGEVLQKPVAVGASSVVWSPLAPDEVPNEDKLYRLVLSFTDAQASCVGAETARVAVVRSVFAGSCGLQKPSKAFKVPDAPVFAYDSAWVGGSDERSVKLGAEVPGTEFVWEEMRPNDSGWFGLDFAGGWKTGKPMVSCEFSEAAKMIAQIRFPVGMCLFFR